MIKFVQVFYKVLAHIKYDLLIVLRVDHLVTLAFLFLRIRLWTWDNCIRFGRLIFKFFVSLFKIWNSSLYFTIRYV